MCLLPVPMTNVTDLTPRRTLPYRDLAQASSSSLSMAL